MIMRNCCCCKVTTGSIILGVLTLISSAIILIPLVGYLLEVDIDGLNVIQSNQKVMEKVLEDGLERHTWTTEAVNDIMTQVRSWLPTIILVCALYAGVTAIFSLLLIIGVSCQVIILNFIVANGHHLLRRTYFNKTCVDILYTFNWILFECFPLGMLLKLMNHVP